MPALDPNTVYCHLVDREDSDNLVVPGTLLVGGSPVGGSAATTVSHQEIVINDTLLTDNDDLIIEGLGLTANTMYRIHFGWSQLTSTADITVSVVPTITGVGGVSGGAMIDVASDVFTVKPCSQTGSAISGASPLAEDLAFSYTTTAVAFGSVPDLDWTLHFEIVAGTTTEMEITGAFFSVEEMSATDLTP